MKVFPFLFYVDARGPMFPMPAIETRPRLTRKTHWHKDKAKLMGTRNCTIVLLKSAKAELEELAMLESRCHERSELV